MYLNTAVAGLIEIPAYIFCIIIIHFMGRRMPLVAMFIVGGVFLLITCVMSKGIWMMVVVMAGKFGIICIFAMIYLHSSEVFPTVIRTTGLGTCSMFGRIGSMLAPIIGRELGAVNQPAAVAIFATLALMAGVLTLWLPETRGKKLADTIEEGEFVDIACAKVTLSFLRQIPGEKLGREKKLCDLRCWRPESSDRVEAQDANAEEAE